MQQTKKAGSEAALLSPRPVSLTGPRVDDALALADKALAEAAAQRKREERARLKEQREARKRASSCCGCGC